MFLVDRLLLSPARALFFCFREICDAAESEASDSQTVVQELQDLYMLLETGKITEHEFQLQESTLLDRLEGTWHPNAVE